MKISAFAIPWRESLCSFFFFLEYVHFLVTKGADCFSSVQSLSHLWLFVNPWTAACQASLSITKSRSLLKLMSIESVMPSNHLILCRPLLFPPSIFPSIRVFSNESVLCITWLEYWSFSFSPYNEYILNWFPLGLTGLISLHSNGLSSHLQHHSSKASILYRSAFFMVQHSHPYMTTGKTIVLLDAPLLAEWCLCSLVHCLGLSQIFFQETNIF